MSGKTQQIWLGIGIVLLLLGLVDLGDAFFGSGRLGAGRLFYDGEQVDELVAQAVAPAQGFARACGNELVVKQFDSRSLKKLERWCGVVDRFIETPSGSNGVALLRANNRLFETITDKLFLSGGPPAQVGLELMTARKDFRPLMEQVGSIRAGASFSEALIGIFFLVAGWLCLRRGRRSR